MTAAPAPATAPTYTLTLLDVYTAQLKLEGKVDVMNTRLEAVQGLETRIRGLENAKARVYGVAATLGVLTGGGAGWAALMAGHH